MPRNVLLPRSIALLIPLLWIASVIAVPAQRPSRPGQGDVFSSNSRCVDKLRGNCLCPEYKKSQLAGENARHDSKVRSLKTNLEYAEQGLKNPRNTPNRNLLLKVMLRDATRGLAAEEKFHKCRTDKIDAGCPWGWERACLDEMPKDEEGPLEMPERPPKPVPRPPDPFPMRDPTFWKGFNDGMDDCFLGLGQLGDRIKQALEAMGRGDFRRAAVLLGATETDAGVRSMAAALQSLWDELHSGRSTPRPGEPIPMSYEIGKHGAERLCLFGLIPAGQSCAVQGTICATKATLRGCSTIINKIAKLRRVRKPNLPPPPSPLNRGLLLPDEKYLQELAATEGKIFIVRDSYADALRWAGRSGYKPKPLDLKGKTLRREDLAGLPKVEADKYVGLASAKGLSLEQRTELLKKGYKIASPGDQELIRGPSGEKFYSDTDLHGVYNLDGTNGWNEGLLEKLGCHFFDRGVQHGPHDNWLLRNNRTLAGPNYGPQVGNGKTLTAIFPDGTKMWVRTLQEMKELYRAIGVDWKSVYPYH